MPLKFRILAFDLAKVTSIPFIMDLKNVARINEFLQVTLSKEGVGPKKLSF